MKLVTVVGARPQFVKAATVSREIAGRSGIAEVIVHTGQHYDAAMSDVFFAELAIPSPDHHLGIGGLSHGAMTGRQVEAIETVLLAERPDWLLVYGDTNSTLAGALAASKLHIPVAHVEAGLRSFNRRMPEELNRILTDHAADLLLAPTETAMANLRREGIGDERLRLVGDVMLDSALFYRSRAVAPAALQPLALADGEFVLATLHRAENVDVPERLRAILAGLGDCGRPVVLPLHPRTRARIGELGEPPGDNLHLVDPVSYLEMMWLESRAAVIATDSGGVQKEAFFFGRPCVTLRDETEWVETVAAGCNRLVGADPRKIAEAIAAAPAITARPPLFGTGDAARRIVDQLLAGAGGRQ